MNSNDLKELVEKLREKYPDDIVLLKVLKRRRYLYSIGGIVATLITFWGISSGSWLGPILWGAATLFMAYIHSLATSIIIHLEKT